jgi:hypothetical protein
MIPVAEEKLRIYVYTRAVPATLINWIIRIIGKLLKIYNIIGENVNKFFMVTVFDTCLVADETP